MKLLYLLIVLYLIAACSSSKQIIEADTNNSGHMKYDESFDPNTLNDDDIVIVKQEDAKATDQIGPVSNVSQEESTFREAQGFRVQILATKSIENATLIEQEAKDLFNTMNHKIYLIFDAPLYKVRVGDVISRDNAEEIRDIAKDYGYREAFIVPSKINIPTAETF
jgi:uncharacterized protein YcfL